MQFRIGNGIDFHQLVADIPLIIGGITIPYDRGSKGHSDGDVLIHTIVDAILGALTKGDIGVHFPSDNQKYKNANSILFLEYANNLVLENGYSIENLDSTVILEKPTLKPYILDMREKISSILSLNIDNVSIKATTTDKLGFIGKGVGIAAMSSILLKK
tara:strand:+ start:1377 stop:1853 length:477 start_codon:yes stop_codon:yes gene_type:complete